MRSNVQEDYPSKSGKPLCSDARGNPEPSSPTRREGVETGWRISDAPVGERDSPDYKPTWGSESCSRMHNQEIAGANPAPATKRVARMSGFFDSRDFPRNVSLSGILHITYVPQLLTIHNKDHQKIPGTRRSRLGVFFCSHRMVFFSCTFRATV